MNFNQFNIKIDLGEIARSIYPEISLFHHQSALDLLNDSVLRNLPNNKTLHGVKLLIDDGYVLLKDFKQKKAWTFYHLALDYLALYNMGDSLDKKFLELHDSSFSQAKENDPDNFVVKIYNDQLKILSLLQQHN